MSVASPLTLDYTDSEDEVITDVKQVTASKAKHLDEDGVIRIRDSKDGKAGSLRKGLGLLDATSLFVGGIIGSGIFITPAAILEFTGSFGVSMLCWLAGTLIAVCGGLCYIELTLLLPRTGGEVVYLMEGYSFKKRNKWTILFGSLITFLFTWSSIVIIRPASVAVITLTCTKYLVRPIYLDCELSEPLIKCMALSILSE